MFIFDSIAGTMMDKIMDWIYSQIVGFLGNFFVNMGDMGAELFKLSWVQSVVMFFNYLGWALFAVGLVVACFELGIECQNGRGNIRGTALNAIKGFLAVGMFTTVPVELYKFSVTLQGLLTAGITGSNQTTGQIGNSIISSLGSTDSIKNLAGKSNFGLNAVTSPLLILFCIILMAYAIIKVFFANLKRGGILLIQIAVGSLYMFSVPRGYTDGFISWCKQIIGLCLTAFLQSTILIAGLMVFQENCLLSLGLMLSAGEIPRIAGAFGLDTSTKASLTSTVYAAQSAINMTKTIQQVVTK